MKHIASKLFLIFIILITSSFSFAQKAITELNEKIRLEKEIKQHLNEILQSRIANEDYNIEIDVKLMYLSKDLIDREHIENNINRQAHNKLNLIISNSTGEEIPYDIESVDINLQLSDKVSSEYKANLSNWLNTWTKSYFNSKGKAQISVLEQKIEQKVVKEKETPLSILYKLQNLIGMIILGSIFLLIWFINKKDKSTPLNVQMPQSSIVPEMTPVIPKKPMIEINEVQNTEATPQIENRASIRENDVAHLQLKVALIAQGMPEQTRSLLSYWLSDDSNDYMKVAAFVEAWALFNSKNNTNNQNKENIFFPIPPHLHQHFQQAVNQFVSLSSNIKCNVYQEIYTSLMSESFTERKVSHFQYDFIRDLHDSYFRELFNYLSLESRITFLMKAPRPLIKRLTKITSSQQIVEILKISPTTQEASESELFNQFQSWKEFHSLNQKSNVSTQSKMSQLGDVVNTLPRIEKAILINQIAQNHPELNEDSDMVLQDHLNSIIKLPPEQIRKFCLKSKTRDLAAAIIAIPFLEKPLTSVCTESMKKDIEYEVLHLNPEKQKEALESFLSEYDNFINDLKVS
ncbi:MAG: hypothetical protein ACK41T_08955 [Pseudobdellovibrio sp.]